MSPQSSSGNVSPIEEIIVEMRLGRMVVLVDEEDRENEGDLILAAEHVTPEAINFMARFGRGLICLTLTAARCRQLGLTQMARDNKSPYSTAFTVSIEAAEGVTTGISAQDRALTIKTAVARNARPEHIVQPGHVFPIMAQAGGVLVRAGHTEAGCDLAQLAGLEPAAVICEILQDDGTMARLPDLQVFAAEHGLKIGTIAASAALPTCASIDLWVLSANFFSSTSSLSRTSFWRAGGTVSSSRCDQPATMGCTALLVS